MLTLRAPTSYHEQIKKSRFIAHAARADGVPGATAFIERLSRADASHNCWAYRVGSEYRFSDAGEPSGTAGRPILAAIDGHGMDHVALVVVRYFGGIKLGAGGLARAYGGCAAKCLDRAETMVVEPVVALELRAGFDMLGVVHPLLARFGARSRDERYEATGVRLRIEVAESRVPKLAAALRDATRGQAELEPDPGAGEGVRRSL